MCQCEFKDNNWAYQMTAMLKHVANLPMALQNPESPQHKWIQRQACDEEVRTFPNTDLVASIEDVLHLQRAAQFPSSGGRLEAHHLCLPGQVAMTMVCAQQYLVKRNLRSVLKWVGKMAEMLSIVRNCMDSDSPLPLRGAEFEQYLAMFQASIPLPESPRFVPILAWPYDARLKGYDEVEEPLLECLPLKDPACFPRHTNNMYESCSECCSPRHGARGHVECWVGDFTYERCCTHSPRPWAVEAEQSQCRGADEKNEELQKALEAEIKQARDLGKNHNSLKEELRTCTERQQSLSKKLHDVEQAFNATKKMSSAEEPVAKVTELAPPRDELRLAQEREADLTKQLRTKLDEVMALNVSFLESQEREANLTKQLQTRMDEVAALNATSFASQEREANLTKQLRTRLDEVAALNATFLASQEREANLTKQLRTRLDEVAALNATLFASQEREANLTKHLRSRLDEVAAFNATVLALQARESNLTDQLQARSQDIAAMNASLVASQEQLRKLTQQAGAKKEESTTRDADLLRAKEQLDDLKAQLQQRDRDFAALETELKKTKAVGANATRPVPAAGDHRAAAAAAAAAMAAAAAADNDTDAGAFTIRIAGGQELPLPVSWLAALLGECAPPAAGSGSASAAPPAAVQELPQAEHHAAEKAKEAPRPPLEEQPEPAPKQLEPAKGGKGR